MLHTLFLLCHESSFQMLRETLKGEANVRALAQPNNISVVSKHLVVLVAAYLKWQ